MATVHLGRLLGPVGFSRTVAIKRLQPQYAEDPEFVSMFLDEARLAARIRHPNVVPTLDVVSTQGELFLVMEYIQGDSLARLLRAALTRGERLPTAMMATLMVGVLNGLHAAHEAKNEQGEPLGLVHRDVSPHNIIVGIDGVARLLDFGVAKAVGRLQTTNDGKLKGKIAYMAPEQVRGTVTRATDIYAASIVLWEALVGHRVFHGDSEAEIFAKVLEGRVESPSQHAAGIPPALDAAVMRGLALDPARRFPTAKEMARAVAESVNLVDTVAIGEWVESLAKSTLDTRSDLVATIESDSVSYKRLPSSDGEGMPTVMTPAPEIPIVADDALPTQLSSGSVSAMADAPPPARKRVRTATWIGAGAGALALLVAAWAGSRGVRTDSTGSATPTSSVTAAALPADAPRGGPPEAPVTTASNGVPSSPPAVSQAAAPSASAIAPPNPAASSATAAQVAVPPAQARGTEPSGTRKTQAAPASTSRKSVNCNPPYYFEGGVRVFKTECL